MTSKEKMLKKARNFKVAGCFFLFVLVAIIVFVIAADTDSYIINLSGIASLLLGVILLNESGRVERDWWDDLPLGKKCKEIARELKSGERKWYIIPSSDDKYYFAPLGRKNTDEFGRGEHLSASKDEVLRLVREGKIEHSAMAMLIISYYESIF